MLDDVEHVVGADEAGNRFDRLVARLSQTSRAEARILVESMAATLDGHRAAPATRLRAGSTISVRRDGRAAALAAAEVDFEVALERSSFVVVDKPAGLVVHPGAGHDADTLVNGLVGSYPELRELGPDRNWGLVHRLDRDTSGLLLVARNPQAHEKLQSDLRERTISRKYLALAAGQEFDNATGTIEAPIGRDPVRRTRMAVVRDGKPARTHYVRLASWPGRTLLEVTLDTGRTHQIRVHFAAIGSALVGDRIYGSGTSVSDDFERVWLHAAYLGFEHPETGSRIELESRLPDGLVQVVDDLGAPTSGAVPVSG